MRFLPNKAQLLLIDVQEKLLPHMYNIETLVPRMLTLLQGIQTLGVPVLVSEQYKKGLGETDNLLKNSLKNAQYFEKSTFSCLDDHELAKQLILKKRE
jgi:nicotinamidase-related amidase